jgi:hypothetical protein
LRMACNDGDPLRDMPLTTTPELPYLGVVLKLSEWSALNKRPSKWMPSSWMSLMPNKKMSLVGLHR